MDKDTNYYSMLCEMASKGHYVSYNDEESLKIVEELNEGRYEFELAERKRNVESELELKTLIIM